MPGGLTAFQMLFFKIAGIPGFRAAVTLDSAPVRNAAREFRNVKVAAGEGIDIALQVAKAIEPYDPLF